jgi:hypothetical protein
MLRYNDKIRVRWDLFVIVLALWNCVMIPLNVAFDNIAFDNSTFMTDLNIIIDVAFGLDVISNFRTTFINTKTGVEVTSGMLIAKHYVFKGRFVIDLFASIPFDDLFLAIEAASHKTMSST